VQKYSHKRKKFISIPISKNIEIFNKEKKIDVYFQAIPKREGNILSIVTIAGKDEGNFKIP